MYLGSTTPATLYSPASPLATRQAPTLSPASVATTPQVAFGGFFKLLDDLIIGVPSKVIVTVVDGVASAPGKINDVRGFRDAVKKLMDEVNGVEMNGRKALPPERLSEKFKQWAQTVRQAADGHLTDFEMKDLDEYLGYVKEALIDERDKEGALKMIQGITRLLNPQLPPVPLPGQDEPTLRSWGGRNWKE